MQPPSYIVISLMLSILVRDYGDSGDHEGYEPPFRFTGTVKRVTYDLSGDAIKDAEAEMRKAMAKQ